MSLKVIYVSEAPGMVVSFYGRAQEGFFEGQPLVIQALTGGYCFKLVERVYHQGNGWSRIFLL